MKAIGIDLGTTNSAAASCRPGSRDPKVLPTRAGESLTPSVVSLKRSRRDPSQSEILVGRAAVNNAPSAPQDTIFSVKRLMGFTYEEERVAKVRDHFNYVVLPPADGSSGLLIRLGDHDYTPPEISALILKQIKADAEKALGEEVTHAVITVPAYFEERQRAATREAGEQAGFVVKKIIDEPTAAAIAFGANSAPSERHRILVYDLGGGTFDISILQMVKDNHGRDQVQVLDQEGDNWLGGDDFDRKIVERVLDWVRGEYDGLDLSNDKRFLLLARKHAEEAKRGLSEGRVADIVIPAAVRTEDGAMVDVEVSLSREEFESSISSYVSRTMELVLMAMGRHNFSPDDISDVLLVGGSTLIPLVYRTVEDFFGKGKVRRGVNPMEAVALGAGVLAETLAGVECPNAACKTLNDEAVVKCEKCGASLAPARSVGDTVVTEVTARSFGVRVVRGGQDNYFDAIIPKSTPYPLKEPKKKTFLPTSSRLIRVPVFEGEDQVATKNEEQGVVEFELPQEIGTDTPVEVAFNYDRDRVLTVTIQVVGTALRKTEPLRRDRPRTLSLAQTTEPEEDLWQAELERTISFVEHFLQQYGEYMDVGTRRRLESELKKAQNLMVFPEEVEGRRIIRVLEGYVFNSGLASQLYMAERLTEGGDPALSQRIRQAIDETRAAHAVHNLSRVQEITKAMRPLVAQAMAARSGVRELADQADFGGLLRSLED